MATTRYAMRVHGDRPWRETVELIRDLSGCGLVEARQIVSGHGTVHFEADTATAGAIAERIAEHRILVHCQPRLPLVPPSDEEVLAWLEAEYPSWRHEFAPRGTQGLAIAWDPKHPLGPDQPLIRAVGAPHHRGPSLLLVEGRIGAWTGPHEIRRVEDIDKALAALANEWRASGLRVAADPVEIISHFSARNLELEAAINQATSHAEALDACRVYFDWLAEQGDPRGRAGQLCYDRKGWSTLASADEGAAVFAEYRELTQRHAAHLAMPLLGPEPEVPLPQTLTLTIDRSDSPRFCSRTLQLPTLACLRVLTVRRSTGHEVVVDFDPSWLTGLEFLCTNAEPSVPFTLPRLRHLMLHDAGVHALRDAKLPMLDTLELSCFGDADDRAIVEALRVGRRLPIQRLFLRFRGDNSDVILEALAEAAELPLLRELIVRAVPNEDPAVPDCWPAIVDVLPTIPGMSELEYFGYGEPDEDTSASLEAAFRRRHARSPTIECTPHFARYRDPHTSPPRGYSGFNMGYALHIESSDHPPRLHIESRRVVPHLL